MSGRPVMIENTRTAGRSLTRDVSDRPRFAYFFWSPNARSRRVLLVLFIAMPFGGEKSLEFSLVVSYLLFRADGKPKSQLLIIGNQPFNLTFRKKVAMAALAMPCGPGSTGVVGHVPEAQSREGCGVARCTMTTRLVQLAACSP